MRDPKRTEDAAAAQVVPMFYKPLGASEATLLYEYTISSNHYALEPPFVTSGEAHDGPIIKIAYDLSPLQARKRRRSRCGPLVIRTPVQQENCCCGAAEGNSSGQPALAQCGKKDVRRPLAPCRAPLVVTRQTLAC